MALPSIDEHPADSAETELGAILHPQPASAEISQAVFFHDSLRRTHHSEDEMPKTPIRQLFEIPRHFQNLRLCLPDQQFDRGAKEFEYLERGADGIASRNANEFRTIRETDGDLLGLRAIRKREGLLY